MAVEAVAMEVAVDPTRGLSSEEAAERLTRHGANVLEEEARRSWMVILVRQFNSPIVVLLVVAAALSLAFQEWLDGIAILAVLLVNALVGFFMEYQADRAMRTLTKLFSMPAKVLRDGRTIEVDQSVVVPGDVIYLEAGDMVPADARVYDLVRAQADEAALTGESIPVEKQVAPVPEAALLAERADMVYKATFLTAGHAHAIVVATGMSTELGRIAHLVQRAEQAVTPLEKRLEALSRKLIALTVGLVVVIFLAGLMNARPWMEMLQTSIALAVAAIPEGLPIVATMALAQGMLRMARQNVIVKRLSAVETLGSTDIICTDKTGTLTESRMKVVRVVTPLADSDQDGTLDDHEDRALVIVRAVAVHCNTASLEAGDPLETGLLRFALRQGEDPSAARSLQPKLREEPFSPETRIMATLHRAHQGYVVYAKGATEELLARCTQSLAQEGLEAFDGSLRKQWIDRAGQLAIAGLRVIATAYKTSDRDDVELTHDLVFTGLVGMMDPPRPEVAPAIAECRKAGIRVVMLTGDHPDTARSVYRQLVLRDEEVQVVNGRELPALEKMAAPDQGRLTAADVFARVSPRQKLDLVTLLQSRGHVVGMTGDGLNDAPALKKADIGIAMGIRGTQVSQDVADIVLKDDKFTSIVLAIRQGRVIFRNIRNVVIYLLSCNLSELLVIAFASVLGLHFQLFPLQILFINLVTDVLPALALGVIGADAGIMNRPPRNANVPILDARAWKRIGWSAALMGISAMGAVLMSHFVLHDAEPWNAALCNNILFFTLIAAQLLFTFNMGSTGVPFLRSSVVRDRRIWIALLGSAVILAILCLIPPVRSALHIGSLSVQDGALIVAFALVSFLLVRGCRVFILDRR